MRLIISAFSVFVFSFAQAQSLSQALVDVQLSPTGSFEIQGTIHGSVQKKGEILTASDLKFLVRSLETGRDIRNKHTKEKLGSSYVEVPKAVAKDGKGKANIVINGIKKKVPFSYEDKGKSVLVNFDLSLSDFGIEVIRYMGIGVVDKVGIRANLPLK